MADGSGDTGSGGVPGAGGVKAPPGKLAGGVAGVPAVCPTGTAGCPPGNHWVRAELRNFETQQPVPWADGQIFLGFYEVNSGPLFLGVLESRDLYAATYSVTFPDIDAGEWWEA